MEKTNQKKANSKQRSGRKFLVILAVMLISLLANIGVALAYFSHYSQNNIQLTGGTLNLNGTYNVKVNGINVAGNAVNNLNPGDIINLEATIVNNGNKSAWIREVVEVSSLNPELFDFFYVIPSAMDRNTIEAKVSAGTISEYLLEDGKYASTPKVINGSGANAETETGGPFTRINDYQYSFTYTFYFAASAGNELQGVEIDLATTVQALQYRNNNSAYPTESAWEGVAARLI